MQAIRRLLFVFHWWGANAGILAVPTYGWLSTQEGSDFPIGLQVAVTLIASASVGLLIEAARDLGRRLGHPETIQIRTFAFLATDGVVFATCFVGWKELTIPSYGEVPLIVAAVSTVAARRMRIDSKRLAEWYGL